MSSLPLPDPVFGVGMSLFSILRLLRDGAAMTRPELVATTGLGRRVVAQRVDDLIASGLVSEGPPAASTGGRPPAQVVFCPDAGCALVAEISPFLVRVGLCDLGGRLLEWREEPVSFESGPESILGRIEANWDELLASPHPGGRRVMAIGIGVLGPVDPGKGDTIDVHTPFGWEGYHVRDRLTKRYNAPAWVDNEVNMMAIGEYRQRAGRGSGDLVLVMVDEGIGAGLISNGRIHRGVAGIAGEIGHVSVSQDPAITCWCGGTGCLTQVASAEAIERAFGRDSFARKSREASPGPLLPEIVAAARAGDAFAVERFRIAGEATGRVLAGLVNVFNPADIVLGGSVATAGDLFLAPLEESLHRWAFPAAADHVSISVSPHSERLGLVGAGITAVDGLLTPEFAHWWLPRPVALAARQ